MRRQLAILGMMVTVGCASTPEGFLPPDAPPPDGPGFIVIDAQPIVPIDAPPAVPDAPIVIETDAGVPDAPIVLDAAPPDARPPVDARPDATPPDGCADLAETCNGFDDNCNDQVDEGYALEQPCSEGTGYCRREGVTECTPDGVGVRCSVRAGEPLPGGERCGNQVDDDCDGLLDEGFDELGDDCSVGVGECHRNGEVVCGPDGVGTVCGVDPGNPAPVELCGNFADDDCDEMIDEGFDVGTVCTSGTGVCERSGIKLCSIDGTTTECNAVPGPPGAFDLCGNGVDDDCNGAVDEGYDVGAPCSAGTGICERPGVMACTLDGAATECNAVPGPPGAELCGNGIDENCNGPADDTFDVGAVCTSGMGICAATGVKVCTTDLTGTTCSATPGTPLPAELCGNGADDDCDGAVDEGFDVGTTCTVGIGACAATGFKVCTANGLGTECNAVAGTPGTELCLNNSDDDCDGMLDEGFEDLGTLCTVGLGVCERAGAWLCTPGSAALHCSATPGPAGPVELCDNLNPVDDDCDGTVDEGFEMKGSACSNGTGACANGGQMVCTTNKLGLACNAVPLPPGPELCGDGIDNDCDTGTDEGYDVGTLCDGLDGDLCLEGVKVCRPDRLGTVCNDVTGHNVEICDGADNDCNPSTVDGVQDPNLGALCDSLSDSDQCLEGNRVCTGGALQCTDPANDNTTNDPDHCGACDFACANPHGGRFCTASTCTPTCSSGWQACGDPALGCLSNRNTNPACSGGNLGTIEGDGGGGGTNGTNTFALSGYSEARYFFRVADVAPAECLFHSSVGVRLTFKNPPNVRFRACSRCFNCGSGGAEVCVAPAAGASEVFYVTAFENCNFLGDNDDSHNQHVRIEWISGDVSSCDSWTLDIKGDQDGRNDQTCGGDD